jgi:hypothetical protein
MQEKMNCADDVEDAKDSSSEEEDDKKGGKDHLDYNKVAQDSMNESIQAATNRVSSAGVSSDDPLNQASGRLSTPPAASDQYNLPEDQEIQEATEEEEED